MNKTDTIKKLNENALSIWCSDTTDNILTIHYNYLWSNKKQINPNTTEKCITFQCRTQNEKGEYPTFDNIITEKKYKHKAVYKVNDIIIY